MELDLIGSVLNIAGDVFAKHGPAVPAVAQSFSPGDFSIRFFLQLAVIMLACRVVGWFGRKFLGQPQVVG
ncbi:MAG: cation:proton antiporter, partial [Paucibacter sp.]|nr:cation:proton antiporter [Roseateles sp.]